LLGVALSAIGGILFAEFLTAPVALLCLTIAGVALLALIWPDAWLTHLLLGASFFLLHLWQQSEAPGKEMAMRLGDRARPVSASGMVASEPRLSPSDFNTFFLRLDQIDFGGAPESCRATVRVRCRTSPEFGDRIQLRGMIEPIPAARNPGVFDLRSYLRRRDIYQAIFARYPSDVSILEKGGGDFLQRSAIRARKWMEATLAQGLEDSPDVIALINGMALGIRHDSPDDIEEPFQQTGTLHLFAVAGLHVGIVAQLLWIVASLLRLPRVFSAALIIPCLFFYSAVTGFHVSSLRAATMAAFLLGGIFFDRPVFALNSLAGAAVLILAVDSNQLFTSGFQLSFAVVGAILVLQNPMFRVLLRPGTADPFLPPSLVSQRRRMFERAYRWLAGGISVSTAAWIGSFFLIIWYFYLITPISLLANLLVIPVAFCVLAAGLISLLSAPLSSALSFIFNNANWSLASFILWLVQVFADLPAGHFYVEPPHWPSGARAEITVLDAGAGGVAHLRSGGQDWLFDAGSARDYERFLRDYLHSRGIDRLDGLLLSHGDSLHIGGAIPLLDEFKPGRVIDNAAPDRSSVHQNLIVRLSRRETAATGDIFQLSRRVAARVLYPPKGLRTKSADDQALVAQFIIDGSHRVLLVSDSGLTTERALLARPDDIQSEIMIKSQHSSGESGSPEFLDAVQPRLIVASSVEFPARERISDEWATMVRERGIRLFRQDETGAVRLEFFPGSWRATGFVNHETLRSSSR
jgi:ComEC/Rec2-related protein